MLDGLRLLRAIVAGLALSLIIAVAAPAGAQQPRQINPTASAVQEEQLLRELNSVSGRTTLPDAKSANIINPPGRDYRGFHESALPWVGGIAIIGMLIVLALFYFAKGPIRFVRAGGTGAKILRFNAFERFTHWLTATSFILLALSGLNYIFGKRLLMPLIGPDAFAVWSQYAKYIHNYLAWPFMIGILIMLVLWVRHNLPDRYDAGWLRAGGGFFNNTHPPARRFNAGQKLIFWSVIIGGLAMSISGLIMLFPFSAADMSGMQWAQYVHATIGVLLIAVILAHIYIGSLGMEGAYAAMNTGEVDLAWAKTHHPVWVEEEEAKRREAGRGGPIPAPAE
jgi:formate dehydrogenase subunit gamma